MLLVCPVSGYPIHKVEWSTQHQIIKEICQTVHKLKRLFTYSKTFLGQTRERSIRFLQSSFLFIIQQSLNLRNYFFTLIYLKVEKRKGEKCMIGKIVIESY